MYRIDFCGVYGLRFGVNQDIYILEFVLSFDLKLGFSGNGWFCKFNLFRDEGVSYGEQVGEIYK